MTRTLRSRWGLLALLLLFTKGMIVLSLGDVFFYGEELEKGAAAKAMMDGLDVPHYQLAYHYYEGGGLVISHCIAVAFAFVGQNLLALKLVAIAFQLAMLAAGAWVALRMFGRAASTSFGLLFIVGPASMQKLSLLSLGIHFEAGLFLLLSLGLGARVLFEPSSGRRDWFLLGLVTGFGIYFSYLALVMGVWLGIVLTIMKPRMLVSAHGGAMACGALLGLAPWFAMLSLVGDEVWNVHGSQLLATSTLAENVELFGGTLNSLFFMEDGGLRLTVWVRAAVFTWAIGFLLRARRSSSAEAVEETPVRYRALLVGGFMALLLVALLASGFVPGEVDHFFYLSRLVPFWLMGTLIASAAIGGLWDSKRTAQRTLGVVLLSGLVGAGVFDTRSILAEGRPGQLVENWNFLRQHKGYSYPQYFEKVLPHFSGTREEKLELIEDLDELATGTLRASVVSNLFTGPVLGTDPEAPISGLQQATEILGRVAGEDAVRFAEYKMGLGQMIVQMHGWRRAAAMRWARHLPETDRAAVLEALGRFGWKGNPTEESLREALRRAGNHRHMGPYIHGLGRWAYPAYRLDPGGFEALRRDLPDLVARDLTRGFEAERASNLLGGGGPSDTGLASF